MSSSSHIDNKKKDILILGKDPTQRLEHTMAAEKLYSINFTKENTKFCLSLHYNGANSYLFVNGTEIIKFKAKDSEITAYPLCLGNISKDWSVDNMKKTGLKGYVYDFSVDYDTIAFSDILDIHKCNYQMGYWVVGEYWLIIHCFNEQTAIINIYTFTFKNLNEYILTLKQP